MRKLFKFANYNNRIVSSDSYPIPQTELGTFTTMKIKSNIPLFLDRHIDRLKSSCKTLEISINLDSIKNSLKATIEKNNYQDCGMRISILEGSIFIHAFELPLPQPVKLMTIDDKREKYKNIKMIDRNIYEKAIHKAQNANYDDALLTKENFLIESTYANILSINKSGDIITPPLDGNGLPGIIRQLLIDTLNIKKEQIPINTLQPLMTINCLRIQPITHINENVLQTDPTFNQYILDIVKKKEIEYIKDFSW